MEQNRELSMLSDLLIETEFKVVTDERSEVSNSLVGGNDGKRT